MTTTIQENNKEIQAKPTIADIGLHKIRTDRTQSRCKLDDETVAKYANEMECGVVFDPATVYHDIDAGQETYWLADGFHRYAARKAWGANTLTCEVRIGTERDALEWSLKANAKHGLNRTTEDKWRAVELALKDEEWSTYTHGKLAELCGVSDKFVAKVRLAQSGPNGSELETDQAEQDPPSNGSNQQLPKRIGRDGKSYAAIKPRLTATTIEADDDQAESTEESDDVDGHDDQDELDMLTPRTTPSVSNTKAIKSGSEDVSSRLQKEAMDLFGRLSTRFHTLKIARDIETEWEVIRRRLLTVDGPAREMKDGTWVPITGPAEWRDGDWHEVEVDDDEGWGAPNAAPTAMPMQNAA